MQLTRSTAYRSLAAALVGALLAGSAPAQAMQSGLGKITPAIMGYNYDAENINGGVRWGYASLYRAPVQKADFEGCRWDKVPTAYGARFRPVCN